MTSAHTDDNGAAMQSDPETLPMDEATTFAWSAVIGVVIGILIGRAW